MGPLRFFVVNRFEDIKVSFTMGAVHVNKNPSYWLIYGTKCICYMLLKFNSHIRR